MEKFIVISPYFLPQVREETTALSKTTKDYDLFEMGNVQCLERGATPLTSPPLQAPEIKDKNISRAE